MTRDEAWELIAIVAMLFGFALGLFTGVSIECYRSVLTSSIE
jgi:hypothetical protein